MRKQIQPVFDSFLITMLNVARGIALKHTVYILTYYLINILLEVSGMFKEAYPN
jgi:hypothetical protein